jgi:hypothetical protein
MRFFVFVCGITIIAMGVATTFLMPKDMWPGFLRDALSLGGGLIICGLFSLKMPWHGLVGAGVLALLGGAVGLKSIPAVFRFTMGDHSNGSLPVFEFGVTAICLLLLMRVTRTLLRERQRRMLEDSE